jgi:hypothetical protein
MILLTRSDAVDLEIGRVSDSGGRILACGITYVGFGAYDNVWAFVVVDEPEVWEEPMPRFPKLRSSRDRNSAWHSAPHPCYCLGWERDPEDEEEEEEAEEAGEEHSGVDQEEED